MTAGALLAATEADLGVAIAAIVVLGVGAQVLASRIGVPSILLLLLCGVAAGPVLGVVDPDELLGDTLFPAVSIAVGILLFEGGLGLRYTDLERHGRGPVLRLVTVGVVATWVVSAAGAHLIIGLDPMPAILLGAVLVVSGPTVVLPLLRFARPREPVLGILRWEGIFIDPIGATLAIVVLGALIDEQGPAVSVRRVLTTTGAGTAAGLLAAALLVLLLSRNLVPDALHNPFTLALVVAAVAAADVVRPEAGLFAATVMGVALANQRFTPIGHIQEFEENLGTLILSALFIVLGARVDLDELSDYLPQALLLSTLLIVVARPLAVYVSTVGSGLSASERAYLACYSPRGIVAAAVSALFALELAEAGKPEQAMVPVTFVVIVVTAVVSAVASRVGARSFRVARPPARGLAFLGGAPWVVQLASWLTDRGVVTLIVTSDLHEAADAASHGLLTYTRRLDSEDFTFALQSVGVAAVVGTSRFQERNALGISRAMETVGRANVFHLPTSEEEAEPAQLTSAAVVARRPFGQTVTQDSLEALLSEGAELRSVTNDESEQDIPEEAIPVATLLPEGLVVHHTPPDRPPAPGSERFYVVPVDPRGGGGSCAP